MAQESRPLSGMSLDICGKHLAEGALHCYYVTRVRYCILCTVMQRRQYTLKLKKACVTVYCAR